MVDSHQRIYNKPPHYQDGDANCVFSRNDLLDGEVYSILSDDYLLRTFKKKAPNAIKEIKKFAKKAMGTPDVRVDVKLNMQIWSRGIRSVPRRISVRIARKRNEDEDAKEELYSLVTVAEIPAEGLKGLGTMVIDDEE